MRVHIELHVARDWRPLRPGTPGMLGGTERIALRLARQLAERGHAVTLRGGEAAGEWEGVGLLRERDVVGAVEALVCVQAEAPLDVQAGTRVAWSHSAQWPGDADWDSVIVGSSYHAEVLGNRAPELPIQVISPGVDLPAHPLVTRDRFLYAFSPDRGLHHLLAIWPEIFGRFGVPLAITYDLRAVAARYPLSAGPLGERLGAILQLLDQPGVIVHGDLDDRQMDKLRARSLALLYPLDPAFPHSELLSHAVLEGCAAGCPPVLAPVDAFPQEYASVARFVDPGAARYDAPSWIAAIGEVLDDWPAQSQRAREFAAGRSWGDWLAAWETILMTPGRARSPRVGVGTRQRWVVLASGDSGELGLAAQVAGAAHERGHDVQVFADSECAELRGPWRLRVSATWDAALSALGARVDRVVLCSSLACKALLPVLEAQRIDAAAVEHMVPEWLESTPGAVAIRQVLLTWPQGMLDLATAGAKPVFAVSKSWEARVRGVGWAPPVERAGGRRANIVLHFPTGSSVPSLAPDEFARALDAVRGPGGIEVHALGVGLPALPQWVVRVSDADLGSELGQAALLICGPDAHAVGMARATGVPVLVLAPGGSFSVDRHAAADRFAHTAALAGEAEVAFDVLPAATWTRAIHGALQMQPEPSGGGVELAVRLIEGRREEPIRPAHWRPPELRT